MPASLKRQRFFRESSASILNRFLQNQMAARVPQATRAAVLLFYLFSFIAWWRISETYTGISRLVAPAHASGLDRQMPVYPSTRESPKVPPMRMTSSTRQAANGARELPMLCTAVRNTSSKPKMT